MPRYLGQHFLKNKTVLEKIVEVLGLSSGDTVIEIGAGHGELTKVLAEKALLTPLGDIASGDAVSGCCRSACSRPGRSPRHPGNNISEGRLHIIAIEKDARLATGLKKKFADDPRVTIVEGDVREILPSLVRDDYSLPTTHYPLQTTHYKLTGNIPYYLTNFLFRIISELPHKPSRAVFTIQREVAERIVAQPPHMNKLAASVQFWAEPAIIMRVPRTDFDPPPRVDSAVVVLEPRGDDYSEEQMAGYYKTVRALFAQPRKTTGNNLRAHSANSKSQIALKKEEAANALRKIGIDPTSRPQNLSIEDIQKIAGLFVASDERFS